MIVHPALSTSKVDKWRVRVLGCPAAVVIAQPMIRVRKQAKTLLDVSDLI
jgi:hypothetical protein